MSSFAKHLSKVFAALAAITTITIPAVAADFVDTSSATFGTFDGVDYIVHTGRFEGATSRGAYRMPYVIVAPANPADGEKTLLIEPPHFLFAPVGRDFFFGRDFLFDKGIRYASVGFGTNLMNALEPFASDLILEGAPLIPPIGFKLVSVVDEEIIIQFTEALETSAFAMGAVGPIDRTYAYGASQTSSVLQEILLGPDGGGVFDLTILHLSLWRPPFLFPGVYDHVPSPGPAPAPFVPPSGVGRVLFVATEGDQIISESEAFRSAVGFPNYRIYEVAGSAHERSAANPLDHAAVLRAMFVNGDNWVRFGDAPPEDLLIAEDSGGGADPVYGFPTGIARDADLNALGGVRLPDLAVGRAQFIASDFSTGGLFAGLNGDTVDLSCAVDANGNPRFPNHGAYVSGVAAQANALQQTRFLLESDAEFLKEHAAESSVGKPGNCN